MPVRHKSTRRKRRPFTYTPEYSPTDEPSPYFGRGSYVASAITLGICGGLLGEHYGGWFIGHCGLLIGGAAGSLWAFGWNTLAEWMDRRQFLATGFVACFCYQYGLLCAATATIVCLFHEALLWNLVFLGAIGWMVCTLYSAACERPSDDDLDI